jgi:NifU-like protein involved in Fe-S cluster formation
VSEGYSETTLDHYENPRNRGLLDDPDAQATRMNPVCGDVLRLTLRLRDGAITDAGFEVEGCVAATAAGSALTDMLSGLSVAEAARITAADIDAELDGLPPARAHGAILAADVLAAALAG